MPPRSGLATIRTTHLTGYLPTRSVFATTLPFTKNWQKCINEDGRTAVAALCSETVELTLTEIILLENGGTIHRTTLFSDHCLFFQQLHQQEILITA